MLKRDLSIERLAWSLLAFEALYKNQNPVVRLLAQFNVNRVIPSDSDREGGDSDLEELGA